MPIGEAVYSPDQPEPTAGHIAVAVGKFVAVWGGYVDKPVSILDILMTTISQFRWIQLFSYCELDIIRKD